jgi:hypothetical protein
MALCKEWPQHYSPNKPMRKLFGVLALIGVIGAVAAAYASRPADSDAWKADYLELREILANSYANLGYASEAGLPLRALDSAAQAEVSRAKTVRAARGAIARFLSAFGDPHLELVSEPPEVVKYISTLASPKVDSTASAADACAAFGYKDGIGDGYSLPFDEIPGFRVAKLDENLFSAASVPGAGENRVGIIRISLFSPHRAKAQCVKAWAERRAKASVQCNEACEDSVYYRTGKLLAESLRKSVIALEREGVSSILIDLGGNGGGSEWVSLAVRAVTGSRLNVHSTLVTNAAVGQRCRWEEAIARRCSNLTLADPDSETVAAFKENPPPKPTRPLFVLVDARTASASEYFAAVLQDNSAARIIGTRTMGAGCGYVDGGGEFVLPHTKLRVRVPNCARLRKDGSNERAGIRPDIELSAESSGIDRAREALTAASQKTKP